MCTFSMEHILIILFNALQNVNEYHYIWGSDLREFGLKGFGLTRVYCNNNNNNNYHFHQLLQTDFLRVY